MLTLITGTPGSGKTLYAVSLIEKYLEENHKLAQKGEPTRAIYADIAGLAMDGVLPAPDDYRTCPDGSVFFYDEIQQRKEFKDSRASNDVVDSLQVHRHRGFDIFGITQFPSLLHQHFRAVVGQHFHLHRGWGMPSATVYLWAYVILNPNHRSNKAIAERNFRFNYPRRLYSYYSSATKHTHKMRIPPKFIFLALFLLGAAYMAYTTMTGKNFLTEVMSGDKAREPLPSPGHAPQQTTNATNATAPAPAITGPAAPQVQPQLNYDPSKPYEVDYTAMQRQVTQLPQFSGCMQLQTKCKCYTQQGTSLDVSIADCKRVISGDMPFNPFVTRDSIQQSPLAQPSLQQPTA